MGTDTEVGGQSLSPDYGMDADGVKFMEMLDSILPPGIYEGMDAVKNGQDVVIQPGVMLIGDGQDRLIRAQTTTNITLTPTENDPYCIANWEFKAQDDWWVEFLVTGNVENDDIVFAKGQFDNNGNLNTLDQGSVRTRPKWSELDSDGNVVDTKIFVPDVNT